VIKSDSIVIQEMYIMVIQEYNHHQLVHIPRPQRDKVNEELKQDTVVQGSDTNNDNSHAIEVCNPWSDLDVGDYSIKEYMLIHIL